MAGADSLRAVLDSVFAGRAYQWIERPGPLAFLGRWLRAFGLWLEGLQGAHPGLFRLLVWGLVVTLAGIFAHALILFLRSSRHPAPGVETGALAGRGGRRSPAELRAEADGLAARGRYVEAMQRDFLALILDLDGRGVLRFQAGKTPADYVREPSLGSATRTALGDLVRALYRHGFARRPCGPDEFAAWRARLGGIEHAPA